MGLPELAVIVVVSFFALNVGMQVLVRRRIQKLQGAPVPPLPGPLGQRVAGQPHALLYFFSEGCPACRAITPKVRALEKQHPGVFAVDVTREPELARALSVMATPSTVELSGGAIAGYHVGPVPAAVWARFAEGARAS
jgi:thiol-disulfide isomerase/thioredoxin